MTRCLADERCTAQRSWRQPANPRKFGRTKTNIVEFNASIAEKASRVNLPAPLATLWWDAKGDCAKAHSLLDELETVDGLTVRAYLHRKQGAASNADYWYQRTGRA